MLHTAFEFASNPGSTTISCVTSTELFNFSLPQFLICEIEMLLALNPQDSYED